MKKRQKNYRVNQQRIERADILDVTQERRMQQDFDALQARLYAAHMHTKHTNALTDVRAVTHTYTQTHSQTYGP